MTRDGKKETHVADESTPQFKNIFMKNIICKGADRAILFQGLPEMTLKNIYLENAVIEARTGVFFSDADKITMKNVQVFTKELPVIDIKNATNIEVENFSYHKIAGTIFTVSGEKTDKIHYINANVTGGNLKVGSEVKEGAVILQ